MASAQIFLCQVTDVKCYNFLVDCFTIVLVFDYPKFQEFIFNTLQSRKMLAWSQLVQNIFLRKIHLKFLMMDY